MWRCNATLTVHGHAHCNALLEAAQLTLVAGDLVDDAAAVVLTGVGGVEVLLDGPAEEPLQVDERMKKEVNADEPIRGEDKDKDKSLLRAGDTLTTITAYSLGDRN